MIKTADLNEGAAQSLSVRVGIIKKAIVPLYKLEDADKQYFEPGLNEIVRILNETIVFIRPLLEKSHTNTEKLKKIFKSKENQEILENFSKALVNAVGELNLGISSQHIFNYQNDIDLLMQQLARIEKSIEAHKSTPSTASNTDSKESFMDFFNRQNQSLEQVKHKQELLHENQSTLIDEQKKSQEQTNKILIQLETLDTNDKIAAVQLVKVLDRMDQFSEEQMQLNGAQQILFDSFNKQCKEVSDLQTSLNLLTQNTQDNAEAIQKVFETVQSGLSFQASLSKKMAVLFEQGVQTSAKITVIEKQQDALHRELDHNTTVTENTLRETKNISIKQQELKTHLTHVSTQNQDVIKATQQIRSSQDRIKEAQAFIKQQGQETIQEIREIKGKQKSESDAARQRHEEIISGVQSTESTLRALTHTSKEQFEEVKSALSTFALLLQKIPSSNPTQSIAEINAKYKITLEDFSLGNKLCETELSATHFCKLKNKTTIVTLYKNLNFDQLNEAQRILLHKEIFEDAVAAFRGIYIDEKNHDLYLFVENCEKGTLRNFLDNEKDITLIGKIKIAKAIATGLQALHSSKVIHRNLSSDAILINAEGKAKLTDFLFAKTEDDNFATVANLQSSQKYHRYKAPEVITGSRASTKADVYSFACVLWEILTGKEFYAEKTIGQINNMVFNEKLPENIDGIDRRLATLIQQCWARKPEDRPDMDSLVKALDVLISAEETYLSYCNEENPHLKQELLKSAAKLDHPNANLTLGTQHYQKNDFKTALLYFEKANNAQAKYNLAIMHQKAQGTQQDTKQAFICAQEAYDLLLKERQPEDPKLLQELKHRITRTEQMINTLSKFLPQTLQQN